jgi:hypothetical protein
MSRGDVELEHLETDDDVDDIIDPDRNKYEPSRCSETASKLQSRHKMKFAMLSIAAFALLAYATGGEVGGLWRPAAVFDPTFGASTLAHRAHERTLRTPALPLMP